MVNTPFGGSPRIWYRQMRKGAVDLLSLSLVVILAA